MFILFFSALLLLYSLIFCVNSGVTNQSSVRVTDNSIGNFVGINERFFNNPARRPILFGAATLKLHRP